MYDILRESWLDELPDATVGTYQSMSNEIAQVIIERINAIGKLSSTDIIRLTNAISYYGADIKKIEKIIAKYTNRSQAQIDRIFEEVAKKNDEFATQFYKYRGIAPKNALNDRFLLEQIEFIKNQTKGFLGQNLANTMAFEGLNGQYNNIADTYKQVIDRAIYEVQGGTVDYNTAISRTIKGLSKGLQVVEWNTIIGYDANGNPKYYHKRLDSQVRQNILDGVRQANQKIMEYHGKEFGIQFHIIALLSSKNVSVRKSADGG